MPALQAADIALIGLIVWAIVLTILVGWSIIKLETIRLKLNFLCGEVENGSLGSQCAQIISQTNSKIKKSTSDSRLSRRGKIWQLLTLGF